MTNTITPALASPQAFGAENWGSTYTATLTGGGIAGNYPEGQVSFYAGPGGDTPGTTNLICTTPDFTTGTGSTSTGGVSDAISVTSPDVVTYSCTSATFASLVGASTYAVEAVFTHDAVSSGLANFANASVTSGTLATVVVDAVNLTPGVTTHLSGTAAGSTVTDQADITTGPPGTNGPTYSPAATVTFQQFTSNACNTPINSPASESVSEDDSLGNSNDGDATSPNITVPSTAGTSLFFDAVYNGNTFNDAATSPCETLTATAATPAIATTASNTATPGTVGTPVTDLVNVTGLSGTNATGDIVLSIHQGAGCTGALLSSYVYPLAGNITGTSASFTASYTPTAIGPDSWSSSYAGDVNNTGTNGPCEGPVLINAVPTPPPAPVPTNGPLSITTHFLPGGMHGRLYAQFVVAHGGTNPLKWSISLGALPPNLQINKTTGEISGTLGAVGTYHFTVTVTDSTAAPTGPLTASQAYTITVT